MHSSRPVARPFSSDSPRSNSSRTDSPRTGSRQTPHTPVDGPKPSTRRGRNAARANAKRTEQSRAFSAGGPVFFGGMTDHDRIAVHAFDATGRYAKTNERVAAKFDTRNKEK